MTQDAERYNPSGNESTTHQEDASIIPSGAKQVTSINIGDELALFVERINSLSQIFPISTAVIRDAVTRTSEETTDFIDKHSEAGTDENNSQKRLMDEYRGEFIRVTRKLIRVALAEGIVTRSFIVSLISQFDVFAGKLVKAYFYFRPEALNSSEKLISFSQLLDFGSIDVAREYLIEKEVEKVLRQNHTEQFEWFENKLQIPLRKQLEAWATFIEVTERRNLFVHTGGVVSNQYLKVCRDNGVEMGDVKIGVELEVDGDYFEAASSCIFEIGVKLAQVIWRKLAPSASESADAYLINISYELLHDEKYELAKRLLDFSMIPAMKHPSGVARRILTVNRAQAYKWSGDENMASTLMKAEDWNDAREDFQLAAAVLADDFEPAANIMIRIGKRGRVSKSDYREWPLFRKFRNSEEFRRAFEVTFGEAFETKPSKEPE